MFNSMKKILHRSPSGAADQRNELVSEIKALRTRMEEVDNLYNLTSDMDLIDYYILEYKALVARYRYLMRLVREHDVVCSQEIADIKG